MADPIVGRLRINLAANLAEFREGMRQATRELRKFQKSADRVGKNLQGIGGRLSLALTTPLVLFGRQAIKTARDAEELESAFGFSFGNMTDEVSDFAVQTSKELRRSELAIKEQLFTFNQFFRDALDPRQAAEFAKELTLLTNDFSSFFNVTEDDALRKFQSALAGEVEPLRRYGINLDAATVKAKAFQLGLGDANGELSQQDKIIARVTLLQEKLAVAKGDAARTAGSFANTQRALNASLEQLQKIVGEELIPPLTKFLNLIIEQIEKFRELDPQVQKNVIRMAAFGAVVGPAFIAIGSLIRVLGFAARGFTVFAGAARVASGSLKSVRTNALGAVGAFTALAPAAFEAGKAIGNFLAKDEAFINGLIILRAQLPKALGGLGVSAKEVKRELAKVRAEQRRQAEQTREQIELNSKLKDSSVEALNAQLMGDTADQSFTITPEIASPDITEFIDDLNRQLEEINDTPVKIFEDGLPAIQQYKDEVNQTVTALNNVDEVVEPFEQIDQSLRSGSRQIAEALVGLEDMRDAAKRVGIQLLEALAIQPFINSIQSLLVGSGGGPLGGILGSLFGGFRADGGPVVPNRAFMVGERGPELFVPNMSGSIVANDRMGAVTNQNINIEIKAQDPNQFRASQRQMARSVRRELGIN